MIVDIFFFLPFIIVGFGILLAPFISYGWPNWLTNFVEFSVSMGNGVWVAGIAIAALITIGFPFPAAAILSWPVMFFTGRYFARLSEEWHNKSNDIKRRAWEEKRRQDEEQSSDR